jgi:hypothetical protein
MPAAPAMRSRSPSVGRSCRALVLAGLVLLLAPQAARGEWYVVPGLGFTFASGTNLISLEPVSPGPGEGTARLARKLTIQGSVLWLGDGWIGIDGEVCFIAGFFERDDASLLDAPADLYTNTSVTTAMGSVVFTLPLQMTGHSLRPFGIAGFGFIRASADDVLEVLPVSENLLGLRLGGGATGSLTDTVGIRFDLSYFRTLKGQGDENDVAIGTSRSLKFWRASTGVVLRF